VGGRIPADEVDALLARLARESAPVLSRRVLRLTGRGWRAVVAVGGGLAVTALLVGVPALLGLLG